jgi:hypothetical protein
MDAVALIADIVGSRSLPDRAAAQERVLAAFRDAETRTRPEVPAYATVGDEFQVVHRSVGQAIASTTVLLLLLPDELDLRFGIGVGADHVVDAAPASAIRDGSAWWRAREAIDAVRTGERSGRSGARTGFVHDGGTEQHSIRGLLLLRDHIIGRMRPRDRRIALAGLDEVPQAQTAAAEGIHQSAVSQSWHRSGAVSIVEMVRPFMQEDA